MDAVTDMLRAMRFAGGVFVDAQFRAPWCVTSGVGLEAYAPFTGKVPRHVISYHYVLEGTMLLQIPGGAPTELRAGDLVVLPHNKMHLLGSTLSIEPVGGDIVTQAAEAGKPVRIDHGGTGPRTHMVCGFLAGVSPASPLLGMLPEIMTLNVEESASGDWIESSIRFAVAELAAGKEGSSDMLARLAELLFVEAVRRFFEKHPPHEQGWAAALRDPVVARAVGLLHGALDRHWTADDLAREAGLSRSAFAERFTRALGEPPMRYLTKYRLGQAARLLARTQDTISRVAFDVGYESEAAFNRAFKREHGIPPAQWRREQASDHGDAA
ncbi:AraC family transcriptional regulator [Tepidicaulis sp. LMO-SS28]|uniref:AraC family transcriptional regulator n=1 Tax=Tepidicaulis sp. LMO-SS28 TaxID=3447455 RepID=UPI003EDF8703